MRAFTRARIPEISSLSPRELKFFQASIIIMPDAENITTPGNVTSCTWTQEHTRREVSGMRTAFERKEKQIILNVKQFLLRPIQALKVPEGWHSHISWHEGCKFVSPTHRPPLTPRGDSWYSFLLEDESTLGSYCDRKDYVNEKLHWHHRESNHRTYGL